MRPSTNTCRQPARKIVYCSRTTIPTHSSQEEAKAWLGKVLLGFAFEVNDASVQRPFQRRTASRILRSGAGQSSSQAPTHPVVSSEIILEASDRTPASRRGGGGQHPVRFGQSCASGLGTANSASGQLLSVPQVSISLQVSQMQLQQQMPAAQKFVFDDVAHGSLERICEDGNGEKSRNIVLSPVGGTSTPAAGGRWRTLGTLGKATNLVQRRLEHVKGQSYHASSRGLRLVDMPPEIRQVVMDLLPTFVARVRLLCVCRASRTCEWRMAPPFRLDEELSGLGLSDVGARAVAQAFILPQNAGIGELCLGDNSIADVGAQALAAVLASPGSALRRLSLRDNSIGDAGAQDLAQALSSNVMLEELDLWGNHISEVGKRQILNMARCEVFLELDQTCWPLSRVGGSTVNSKMRAILFDWVSQVHTGVNAPVALDGAPDPQDMLFRTYSHLDAYLSVRQVVRTELQLIGVACTMVAAGIDEQNPTDEHELATWLAFVTDGVCTAEEVRQAAREIHKVLEFRLHQPTAYTFLRRYLRRTGWTEESFSLANYLIELAAIDSVFLDFKPQAVAAAAAVLSRQYLTQGINVRHMQRWKTKLLRCADVNLSTELAPCIAAMARVHAGQHNRSNMFVNKKYEWPRLHMVAKIRPNAPQDHRFYINYLKTDHR